MVIKILLNGAQGGSRTRTPLRARHFECRVYAISPPGHCLVKYAHSRASAQLIIVIYKGKIKVIWLA
jgi:hypothetical protein